MNLRHDILAIHDDGSSFRRAKRDVQGGPIFGGVDLLAPEHGVDPRAQAGLLRQIEKQLERFVADAILRVVQENASGLGGHPLSASGIIREEVSQMSVTHRLLMIFEALPRRPFASRPHTVFFLEHRYSTPLG